MAKAYEFVFTVVTIGENEEEAAEEARQLLSREDYEPDSVTVIEDNV